MRLAAFFTFTIAVTALATWDGQGPEPSGDEQILRAAGLNTDGPALLEFFRERARPQADAGKLLELAQKLGDPDAKVRSQTAAQIIACGTSAIPTLRHLLNDLDDPVAAELAQGCLDWLEGNRRTELPIAAARVLAARHPSGSAAALLAYLPFADDRSVVEGVKAALVTLARWAGKPEPALVKALQDPVALRRAIAVEVLCSIDQPEVLPAVRKLLGDPKPQVRLRAALALAQKQDEKAIGVLIELLAELPPAESRLVEEILQQLAGAWAPNPALIGDDDVSRKIRRGAWAAWWQSTEGPALLAAFRKQTLSPGDLDQVLALLEKLGDKSFAVRERAAGDLVAQGPKVAALVREATESADLERAQRAKICLAQIVKTADKHQLPTAAARLLALRKPAGATEALLAYLPFTEDQAMRDEVGKALKQIALANGKPDPVLVKTLQDVLPVRRAAAAETLAAVGAAEHFPAVHKLLKDDDVGVRVRVAVALACAGDKEAVPVLIDLAAKLQREKAWQAEALLHRLAGTSAPQVALGDDAGARKQFRDSWTTWWKKNADKVDLAVLAKGPGTQGLTLVVERAVAMKGPKGGGGAGAGGFGGGGAGGFGGVQVQPGGKKGKGGKGGGPALPGPGVGPVFAGTDRVIEVDRNGKIQWQIDDLATPVDACLLPGNRVLITEYGGSRVTERDFKGTVLWEAKNLKGGNPVNAQRLANGNTFMASVHGMLQEEDRKGAIVFMRNLQEQICAAYKLSNGQVVFLSGPGTGQGVCVRLDTAGKELKRFALVSGGSFVGGIDVTTSGNILVCEIDNVTREYDANGNVVWQSKTASASATRLINGHTLLVNSNNMTVTELDRSGLVVWEYGTPGYRPVRARQR